MSTSRDGLVEKFQTAFESAAAAIAGVTRARDAGVRACARLMIDASPDQMKIYESIMTNNTGLKQEVDLAIEQILGKDIHRSARIEVKLEETEFLERQEELDRSAKDSDELTLATTDQEDKHDNQPDALSNHHEEQKEIPPLSQMAESVAEVSRPSLIAVTGTVQLTQPSSTGDSSIDSPKSMTTESSQNVQLEKRDEEEKHSISELLMTKSPDEIPAMHISEADLAEVNDSGENVIFVLANRKKFDLIAALDKQGLVSKLLLNTNDYSGTSPIRAIFQYDNFENISFYQHWLSDADFNKIFFIIDDVDWTLLKPLGIPFVRFFFRYFVNDPKKYAPFLELFIDANLSPETWKHSIVMNGSSMSFNVVMTLLALSLHPAEDNHDPEVCYRLLIKMLSGGEHRRNYIHADLIDVYPRVPEIINFKDGNWLKNSMSRKLIGLDRWHSGHFMKIMVPLDMIKKYDIHLHQTGALIFDLSLMFAIDNAINIFKQYVIASIKRHLTTKQSLDFSTKEVLPEFYRELADIPVVDDYVRNQLYLDAFPEYLEQNVEIIASGLKSELLKIPGGYQWLGENQFLSFRNYLRSVYNRSCHDARILIAPESVLSLLLPSLHTHCMHGVSTLSLDQVFAIIDVALANASQIKAVVSQEYKDDDGRESKRESKEGQKNDLYPKPSTESPQAIKSQVSSLLPFPLARVNETKLFITTVKDYFMVTRMPRIEIYYFGTRVKRLTNRFPQYGVEKIVNYGANRNLFESGWFCETIMRHCVWEFLGATPYENPVKRYIFDTLLSNYQEKQAEELPNIIRIWVDNIVDSYQKLMSQARVGRVNHQALIFPLRELLTIVITNYMQAHPNAKILRPAMLQITAQILAHRDVLCVDTVQEIITRALSGKAPTRLEIASYTRQLARNQVSSQLFSQSRALPAAESVIAPPDAGKLPTRSR